MSISAPATFVPPDHSEAPAPTAQSTLSEWFGTPQGAYVLAWERQNLDDVVADIFGYYALQIGLPEIDFLRANRITWRGCASLDGRPAVVADAHELPVASESLDLVLLPHLLEATGEPHLILREVERVLRPEGEVVITGFNPMSLWGVKRLFGWAQMPPWDAEFVSVPRMKDWMTLLNFEMLGGRFGCYRPPFASEKWLSRLGFLEAMGRRWWPVAGAVYVIRARKRVAGMRIITPARQRARRAARLVATTARGMGDPT